jgi:hypothetical protein
MAVLNNLSVAGNTLLNKLTVNNGITGSTGSFTYLSAIDASFNNVKVSGYLSALDASFNNLTTSAAAYINGVANFKNHIIQTGEANYISQEQTTNANYTNRFKATDIYGDLNVKRPTSGNGGALRLWDVTTNPTPGISRSSQIYTGGDTLAIINLNVNGATIFRTQIDTSGNYRDTLSFDYDNMRIKTNNFPTYDGGAALPDTNDSSNIIPTTAWVQAAILAAIGAI